MTNSAAVRPVLSSVNGEQDTGSPAWPVTDLLLRNGDFLVKVGGEGLLRIPGGMWKGRVAVGRVDVAKAGRVSMVPRSAI